MCCGAPVIASDRSSLPEVVGLDEAMFDPSDEQAITAVIERGLTDDDYRSRLWANASEQCSQFSWDKTATRAIQTMEKVVAEKSAASVAPVSERPRMAYLSPIAPARSGIADYSEELLPYLSRYYDIDVILQDVATPIADQFVRGSLQVRSNHDFRKYSSEYDRFLYHFGNSPFHEQMFDQLERTGGVVVLHDLYLSGVVAHRQRNGSVPGFWQRELYRSHGYPALQYQRDCEDEYDVDWRYPCSGSVIESADRVIVHSRNSLELAQKWFGPDVAPKFGVVPLLRGADSAAKEKSDAREGLGIGPDEFVVCSLGLLGPTKLNDRLVEAWQSAGYGSEADCRLVFVGENNAGEYGEALLQLIEDAELSNVSITGWVRREDYYRYLKASDVAVQLRTKSRGETSRAALDCLNSGTVLVVNANGAMAELPSDIVIGLPDEFETGELAEALRSSGRIRNDARNSAIARLPTCASTMHPRCARSCISTRSSRLTRRPGRKAVFQKGAVGGARQMVDGSACGAPGPAGRAARKRLFVDVSYLAQYDARSGIQRVVRSLLRELLGEDSPIKVEPVYYCLESGAFATRASSSRGFSTWTSAVWRMTLPISGTGTCFSGLISIPRTSPIWPNT